MISNAISQIPRPGLLRFLDDMQSQFDRLVIFTTVPEERTRTIAALLVGEGTAPSWFAELDYISWSGKTKDPRYVSPHLGSTLLLDDHGPYVHPGQDHLWIEAPLFGSPYLREDYGLQVATRRILERLSLLGRSS